MRSTTLFATLLVVVAVAALFSARRHDESAPRSVGTVALVGDSLNVGVEPYLSGALDGWQIIADDRVGRQTSEGIEEITAGRARLAPYVVVSLGTNDPPGAVETFRHDVARVTRLVGPNRCLVWATIWRDGKPNDAFNDVLRETASANRRLRLVEWAEMVEQHPDWLAPDGLHGSETGYRERARAIAGAVRDCAPGQTVGER
jgi:lysophospholipase L1-like esterase